MDSLFILSVLAAFLVASFLKGLTGLGFSTICLGILALFVDLKLAIPLVFLPSLSSNLLVMIEAGHFIESLKRFWLLYLSALPGLATGIWFLDKSEGEGPRALLGVVMLIYGVWALHNETAHLSRAVERKLLMPVGLLSGFVNGVTGSQIMPIMPFLLSLKMHRDFFIQTINCAFTFNTLVMIIGFTGTGMLTLPTTLLSLVGILPVALGVHLGGRIRRRVSDQAFRRAVLILLILMGLNLIRMYLF